MIPSLVQFKRMKMFPAVQAASPREVGGAEAPVHGQMGARSAQSTGQYDSISCKRKMALLGQPQRIVLVLELVVNGRRLSASAPTVIV
jgi:hypothetical protein